MQTKIKLVENHLKSGKAITNRELTGAPFYLNCPHAVIRDLRKKLDIKDDWTAKYDDKGKIINRFKYYWLESA